MEYITEGLAEFYLKQIMGEIRFYNTFKTCRFFEKCCSSEKLTAAELYKRRLQAFMKNIGRKLKNRQRRLTLWGRFPSAVS